MKSKLILIIGAKNPLLRAIDVVKALPEGDMPTTIVTDALWLVHRPNYILNLLDGYQWERLIALEAKRAITYRYSTVPLSHRDMTASKDRLAGTKAKIMAVMTDDWHSENEIRLCVKSRWTKAFVHALDGLYADGVIDRRTNATVEHGEEYQYRINTKKAFA